MTQLVLTVNNWLNMSSVVDFFQTLSKSYDQYRQYRSTINELSSLSDYELQDIGINRGMIKSVAMEIYTND